MPPRSAPGYRALQAAVVLTTLYLCAGELLPQPLMSHEFKRSWAKQQVVLLMALSGLLVQLLFTGDEAASNRDEVRRRLLRERSRLDDGGEIKYRDDLPPLVVP